MYAVFDYTVDGEGITAKSGGKEDITQNFLQIAAKQWPHLVEEGHIEKREKGEQ